MKKRILVVAAHPDDEILGCGATITRLASEGHSIHILILGEGITSRQHKRDPKAVAKDLASLKKQVSGAAKIVGARSSEVLSFPDNRFDSVDLIELVKSVESVKKRIKPHMIFTHHGSDLNVDHRLVHQAVITAARPLTGETVKQILAFEVPSSTEWQFQSSQKRFSPNFYLEVNQRQLSQKIKALAVYAGESRPFPHPRSAKTLTALATWRGSNCGASYAEAFELVRSLG